MLSEIGLAEASGKKLSSLSVFPLIAHGEDAETREVGKLLVPDVLCELGRHGMDLLEGRYVGDCNLGGRDPDNGTILIVQIIDVEDTATASDSKL